MLVLLLPRVTLPRHEVMSELKTRVEFAKELGGQSRGPFGNLGLVFEFPAELFEEWRETLAMIHFD